MISGTCWLCTHHFPDSMHCCRVLKMGSSPFHGNTDKGMSVTLRQWHAYCTVLLTRLVFQPRNGSLRNSGGCIHALCIRTPSYCRRRSHVKQQYNWQFWGSGPTLDIKPCKGFQADFLYWLQWYRRPIPSKPTSSTRLCPKSWARLAPMRKGDHWKFLLSNTGKIEVASSGPAELL